MTREEKYKEILTVILKKENSKLYEANKNIVEIHIKRLQAYFTKIKTANQIEKNLLELDFGASVRALETIFKA